MSFWARDRRAIWRVSTHLPVVLLMLAACQPAAEKEDIQELRDEIAALAEKLDAIDQKLDGARPVQAQRRPERPTEDFVRVHSLEVGDSPVLGPSEAPITLVEFSDFQCPFCARAKPLIEELRKKYPQDLRVVFKHYPLSFHPAARPVALASMAAQEQGKFWEFHDVLFAHTAELDGSAARIEQYARDAGLDVARFLRDLDEHRERYEARLAADLEQGAAADVRGTPTFYMRGKKLDPRMRSVRAMSALIDSLLVEAKR